MDKPRILIISDDFNPLFDKLARLLKNEVIFESSEDYTKRLRREVLDASAAESIRSRPDDEFEQRQKWLNSIRKKKDRRK